MLSLLLVRKFALRNDSICQSLVFQIKGNLDWIKLSTWSEWFNHHQQRQTQPPALRVSGRSHDMDNLPLTRLTVTFPVPEIEWCVLLYGETLPSIALTYAYQTCLSVYIHYTHHRSHSRSTVPLQNHTEVSVSCFSVFSKVELRFQKKMLL